MVSFSGPRMATPHVFWPTLKYLQENKTENTCYTLFTQNRYWIYHMQNCCWVLYFPAISFSKLFLSCVNVYLSATSTRFLWLTAKSLSLWLCFISSVTPLRKRPIPATQRHGEQISVRTQPLQFKDIAPKLRLQLINCSFSLHYFLEHIVDQT